MTTRKKIYLDDIRETPEGWIRCYWPEEVIEHLKKGDVHMISLDHDLGDDSRGTGYDVLLWIEEAVATSDFVPPKMSMHTSNTSAKYKMNAAAMQIIKLYEEKQK